MDNANSTAVSTDVRFDDSVLADITSWADAIALLTDNGIAIESTSDYGTGFHVVDKSSLVGVPFLIIEWAFNTSAKFKDENGEPLVFVSALAVTKHNEKVIFNDGSTGIRKQLADITDRRISQGHPTPNKGLAVANGLVRSDYTFLDGNGVEQEGTTYYLSE